MPASLSASHPFRAAALPRSHVGSVHVHVSNRVVYHGYGANRRLAVPEQPQDCRRDDGVGWRLTRRLLHGVGWRLTRRLLHGVGWRLTRRLLHTGMDAASPAA